LAAQECAVIQQALHTRTLADQSWELYELIDDWSRDADMPSRGPASYPPELLAGASAYFSAMAAARVRRHRRALQRLAQVRATREGQAQAVSLVPSHKSSQDKDYVSTCMALSLNV
ncbi:MAG TPA: hypothetical protein VI542_03575, partial [Candidatus Tectomicrobia bacterium]